MKSSLEQRNSRSIMTRPRALSRLALLRSRPNPGSGSCLRRTALAAVQFGYQSEDSGRRERLLQERQHLRLKKEQLRAGST